MPLANLSVTPSCLRANKLPIHVAGFNGECNIRSSTDTTVQRVHYTYGVMRLTASNCVDVSYVCLICMIISRSSVPL